MDKAVLQYCLAGVAIVALVVVNIWGVESVAVNTALTAVISSTVWGGIQRKEGYRKGLIENPNENS